MIKRSIHPEDIILHIYSYNNIASKYIKQKLTDSTGETDHYTAINGDSTSLSIVDRPTGWKIREGTEDRTR